jgi:anti-sigma factor RsiW
MTCNEARRLIAAYHDGELDAVRALEIEGHLLSCAGCRVALENLRALSRATQSAYFSAPTDLRANLLAAISGEISETKVIQTSFRPIRWGASALALAAAVLLGFFIAQTLYRAPANEALLAQLTDSHIRSLVGAHLIDVPSSDSHTVRPWFEGKLDFAPPVPDLSADGFPLVGGRVDYIAGRSVAVLVYQRRQHFINLFIWLKAGEEHALMEKSQRGYNVLHWTDGGLTFWAMSEVSDGDLRTFASRFSRSR